MKSTQKNGEVYAFLCSLPELRQAEARQKLALELLEDRLAAFQGKRRLPPEEEAERAALSEQIRQTRRRWAQARQEAARREQEISALIGAVPSPLFRSVLQLRYCEGRRWEAIWELLPRLGLYYSQRQLYRIHARALEEAGRLYDAGRRGQSSGPQVRKGGESRVRL